MSNLFHWIVKFVTGDQTTTWWMAGRLPGTSGGNRPSGNTSDQALESIEEGLVEAITALSNDEFAEAEQALNRVNSLTSQISSLADRQRIDQKVRELRTKLSARKREIGK